MSPNRDYYFLEGGGELGELTRNFDWSATPVGPISEWPQALKATVGIILHSNFPMFLWWGDDMIQFYNDAYRPSLGQSGKHPRALGQKAVECWPEIWNVIYPLIQQVKTTGKSFFLEDQLIPIYRNGKLEDVYWTFSYSSVFGATGNIDGVLVICNETTKKVLTYQQIESSERRASVSEANFRNIILQSPVAMAVLKGPQYTVELANERMFRLWGKPQSELLGRPIFDVLVEARNQGFEELLSHVMTTGETYTAYNVAVTLYRNDREELVYVHFVYEAYREASGEITGIMVAAVDVTDEVVGRKKLEDSENRVRSLVENAPFPIAVYEGREMRIVTANQAIIDVWGKGADVIGNTYYNLLPELESQQVYPLLDGVFTTGTPFHARNQRVDLVINGKLEIFYFNYSFTPLIDETGKVYGVMNTAADVTDMNIAKQKVERSEQNYRNVVKQSPVAMCILMGPEHIVEVASDKIIELWGKPEHEMMNRPIFEGLPEARQQGLEELLGRVYQTGESFYASERPVNLLRFGRQETVYQNFVYEPYRGSDGSILGVVAITIDVTAQVIARLKIEDVVKERTESLRKSNEELSQFAYVASHDLQEPIRKISIFVEQLFRSPGEMDARSRTLLEKIDTSANRMLQLIRDILELSQLSNQAQFENVNLNDVLNDTRNDQELLIEQKHCRILSNELPTLQAVPIQMSQLFGNLVSNAIKFAKPEEPLVLNVHSERLTEEEKASHPVLRANMLYYKLSFADNGIGFNEQHAGRIFEIFQRLHNKTQYKGTGIGLATCKKITDNHGGLIYAHSRPGEGATFTIILPAVQHVKTVM